MKEQLSATITKVIFLKEIQIRIGACCKKN